MTSSSPAPGFPAKGGNLSDDQLVERIRQGETRRFEELFQRIIPGSSGLPLC